MSKMSELDMDLEEIRRVMDDEPAPNEIAASLAVRDLISATQSLSELAASKSNEWRVKAEMNDILLAYIRLGRMISHLRREASRAA